MKTTQLRRRRESGSVLAVTLIIAIVLSLSLASYLMLMSHQNRMVMHGQAWNRALTVAEAGVEDTLGHLNRTFGTNNDRGGANGWVGPAAGPAVLGSERKLTLGIYYMTTISDDALPIITSTGTVTMATSGQVIRRVIRVKTVTEAAFRAAMAARRNIDFMGNDIYVDSYDSSDDKFSTLGKYDYNKRKAGGDVASTEGFIAVGNADVKGKLYTGPVNDGQYKVGSQGSVGDLNWNGPGVQPGWYFNDFNMDFANVEVPNLSWTQPKSKGTNFLHLGSGAFKYLGNLNAKSGDTIYVEAKATLYVTGDFDMKGTIIIAPGASLKIYVGGANTVLNRVNTDGNANTFQYYGLPSNTSVTWNGNDEFVGTIYAPQATLSMGGGGSNTYDFQGACVAKAVWMNGHFNFHFDENLRRKGPVIGFAVSGWEEL